MSSEEQNPERQFENVMIDRVFIDKVSGVNPYRPKLDELLGYVRDDLTLVLCRLNKA